MKKVIEFLKNRTATYYLLFIASILELTFAILYPSFFSNDAQMSWLVFSLTLITFLIGIILLVIPFFFSKIEKVVLKISPFILFAFSLLDFCLFVPVCYGLTSQWNLMDVLAYVIVCAFALLIPPILTTIAIFKKPIKENYKN